MGAHATHAKDNRPTGKMYLADNQLNLGNGLQTPVDLDTIYWPGFNDGIEDIVNHRILPGRAGFYLVIAQVFFTQVVADKDYEIWIMHKTGAAAWTVMAHDRRHSRITADLACIATDIIWIGDNLVFDAFEIWAQSNSGGNTVDILGAAETFLCVQRLR